MTEREEKELAFIESRNAEEIARINRVNEMAERQSEPRPLNLIQLAIEKGYSRDDLKVLFDLYNQHSENIARQAFNNALLEAQKNMPPVVASQPNSQTKSLYAPLEKIQEICQKEWHKQGLCLSFAEEDCPIPENRRIICDIRHIGGHVQRYHIDMPLDGLGAKGNPIGAMNRPQARVSSGTYGQRVLTCDIFDIKIAGADKDGQSQSVPLDADQLKTLDNLLKEKQADLKKFLAWASEAAGCQVAQLADIPERLYARALHLLVKKERP